MKGKVVVMTGATSGIGEVAAIALARMGARLVLVARDRDRLDMTLSRLRAVAPTVPHAAHLGDLSRLSEMKRLGRAIAGSEPRIDVLINNAGAMFADREETEDRLERTFALNHLAYFVLTAALLDRLRAAAPGARIVNTASAAHRSAALDLADLQWQRRYKPFTVYGTSKLCNILFTRELARRLEGSGVTANCLHPGFVATRFGDEAGGLYAWATRFAKLFAISPQAGARTLVYLASSPDVENVSGRYFYKCRPATPRPAAQDDALAKALWEASEKIAAAKSV